MTLDYRSKQLSIALYLRRERFTSITVRAFIILYYLYYYSNNDVIFLDFNYEAAIRRVSVD